MLSVPIRKSTNTCRSSLYFNYHSVRDYSSSRFCFQFAPTLCGLFTIFYTISDWKILPPAEKNNFWFADDVLPTTCWWRKEKETASHSIILRHHPKPIPSSPTRLTSSLCNFVRPPSAFYQVITLPWSKTFRFNVVLYQCLAVCYFIICFSLSLSCNYLVSNFPLNPAWFILIRHFFYRLSCYYTERKIIGISAQ